MHFLYTLGRLYPYWALPIILILGEVGIFFKRKGSRVEYYFWISASILSLGVIAWLIFRGDVNSDKWVTHLLSYIPF